MYIPLACRETMLGELVQLTTSSINPDGILCVALEVGQTAQYESLGCFSSPSGQCNFVVKNPLRNSPLYNYSLFGVILLNHAILKGLIHRECSMVYVQLLAVKRHVSMQLHPKWKERE